MSTKWDAGQKARNLLDGLTEEEINTLLVAFSHGVVAFDLETTGLSPLVDKIIEISAIKILPSGEVETFDELVDPGITIPNYTTEIHGLDDTHVKGAPTIEKLGEDFLEFLEDKPLMAHNARFDAGFLVYDLHQNGLKLPKSEVYCSCQLSRFIFKEFPGHGLAQLVEKLEIPLENHHRALDDALASLRIFAKALIRREKDEEESREEKSKVPNLKATLKASKLFNLEDFNRSESFQIPEHLKELEDYLPHQRPVMIKYKGGSHRNIFRPIRPVSFLPMPDGDVLYAHCLISDLYKSFALRKIKEFRQVKDSDIEEWALLKSFVKE